MEDLLLPHKLPRHATLFKLNKFLLFIQHDSIKVTSSWKSALNSKSQCLVHMRMSESECVCVCVCVGADVHVFISHIQITFSELFKFSLFPLPLGNK